jgi:hypothetical protein
MTTDAGWGFIPLAGEPNPFAADIPRPSYRHIWKTPLDFVGHQDEADLTRRVLARLDPWFFIEEQVPGAHCSGKNLRIDAIVRPRQPEQWHNPNVALGLEFKTFNSVISEVSTHDITGLTAQAIDYTHVDWQGYGRIPIFTCPGALRWLNPGTPGEDDEENFDYAAFMYRHLFGQLGIGELLMYWGKGLTFQLNTHPVWTERNGPIYGKHWGLKARAGSR